MTSQLRKDRGEGLADGTYEKTSAGDGSEVRVGRKS